MPQITNSISTSLGAYRYTRKALFFDLDDTLLNHTLAEELGAALFFKNNASTFRAQTTESFVYHWLNASKRYMEQFLEGKLSFFEQRRRRCQEVAKGELTSAEADSLFEDYLKAYEANWNTFDDVSGVLRTLRSTGLILGIISNGNTAQQMKKLATTGLSEYFDIVLISEAIDVAKPDKRVFQIAANRAGCRIEQCIYVGDSLEVDFDGASAAGMCGVWLNRTRQTTPSRDEGSIFQIYDLAELLSLA